MCDTPLAAGHAQEDLSALDLPLAVRLGRQVGRMAAMGQKLQQVVQQHAPDGAHDQQDVDPLDPHQHIGLPAGVDLVHRSLGGEGLAGALVAAHGGTGLLQVQGMDVRALVVVGEHAVAAMAAAADGAAHIPQAISTAVE
jgi:hypothetical protein